MSRSAKAEPLLLVLAAGVAVILAVPVLVFAWESVAFLGHRPGLVALTETQLGEVCHHLPERTLVWAGELLPVCARCTGLYGGAASGGFVGAVALLSRRALRIAAGLAVLATTIGLGAAVFESLGLLHTGNATRVVLGGLLGLGPTALAGMGLRGLVEAGLGQRKPTE